MKKYYFLVTFLLTVCNLVLAETPFQEGNLVVYRLGTGSVGTESYDLSVSNSAPIFLDEYTFDEDGLLELIQSVPLPETTDGNNISCVGVPSGHQMGLISRSECGRYIIVGGYEAFLATSGAHKYQSSWGYDAALRRRVIARVDVDGNINTTTALTDAYSKKDVRGVTSYDGSQFWITGDQDNTFGDGLTRYTTFGATSSIKINDLTGRSVITHKGQLYAVGQERIYRMGMGLPSSTCSRDTLTSPVIDGNGNTDGLSLDGSSSCFVELPDGNTIVYLPSKNGHIKKYSVLSDGTFKYEGDYLLTDRGITPTNARGIACKIVDNEVHIYFTTSTNTGADGTGGGIYWLIDRGGYNAPFDVEENPIMLIGAQNKTTIRGMAWAPVRESLLTATRSVDVEKLIVYAHSNTIFVESEKANEIEVFSLLGVKVAAGKTTPGVATRIEGLPLSQVYIIKVGNTARKVLL